MSRQSASTADVAREALVAGRAALARYAWAEAVEHLTAADSAEPLGPADLAGLAEAAWWTGRLEHCISARERAYAAFVEAGDRRRAALLAMNLAKDYYSKGTPSVGSGWVGCAERLLEAEEDCLERGYLTRLQGVIAFEGVRDLDRALQLGQRALEAAERFSDRNLQATALHDKGRVLVAMGRVSEGMPLLDEATAAALSGELGPTATAIVYCNMVTICDEIGDFGRAGAWSDVAKRWCERQAIAGFPGMCRVHRASVMRLRGAWPEAEREVRRACQELEGFNVEAASEGFYELGDLRLRVGDLQAAAEAFAQAHELGRDPQPGLALLRIAEGRPDAAAGYLERALADETDGLRRARLLPERAELAVSSGDLEVARAAVEETETLAKTYGTSALEARARRARAILALVEGDPATAVQSLRAALRLWREVDAPYELARVRVVLAEAYRAQGDEEAALLELRAARSTFERLGAAPDLRRTIEMMGEAEAGAAGAPARTRASFMFTDVVRSTNLVEAIGDDAWEDLIRWHDGALRSVFAEHGGQEVHHAGDGFFVAFATAGDALACAVAIQRSLARHRREHGFAPQVRIGVHSAEATRVGGDYQGRGVHEAARIAALAKGSEILASAAAVREEPTRFSLSEVRSVVLRGISEPVEVVSVDWH